MSNPKLGDILLRRGYIDTGKLDAALADQQAFGGKLGRTLVDLGYINELQLVTALAEQLGLSTIDLEHDEIDPDAFTALPVDCCERYGVMPVKIDRSASLLWIACAEPDRAMLQEVAQVAQLTLEPMLAPMSAIDKAVRRYYYGETTKPKTRLGEPMSAIPLDPGVVNRPQLAKPVPKAAPVAKGAPQKAAPVVAPAPQPQPEVQAEAEGGLESVDIEPEVEVELEAPPPVLTGIAPLPDVAQDDVAEIKDLLIRLEKTVSAQGRAFRALVELLQDKGVVRRGELGSRTSKK
jgi:hypothetical protein